MDFYRYWTFQHSILFHSLRCGWVLPHTSEEAHRLFTFLSSWFILFFFRSSCLHVCICFAICFFSFSGKKISIETCTCAWKHIPITWIRQLTLLFYSVCPAIAWGLLLEHCQKWRVLSTFEKEKRPTNRLTSNHVGRTNEMKGIKCFVLFVTTL